MYIKISVFCIKFVNKYYSNYDLLSLMVDIYFQSCTHMHYVTSLAYWLPKLNFHSYLQYVEYLTKNYHSTSPRKNLLYKI